MGIKIKFLKSYVLPIAAVLTTSLASTSSFAVSADAMSASFPDKDQVLYPRVWTRSMWGALAAHDTGSGTWRNYAYSGVTGGTDAFNESRNVERVFFIKDKKVATIKLNNGNASNIQMLPTGGSWWFIPSYEHSDVKAHRVSGNKIRVGAINRFGQLCEWVSNTSGNFNAAPTCSGFSEYYPDSKIELYNGKFIALSNDRKAIKIGTPTNSRSYAIDNNRTITTFATGSTRHSGSWISASSGRGVWLKKLSSGSFRRLRNVPNSPNGFVPTKLFMQETFFIPNISEKPSCSLMLTATNGNTSWIWRSSYTSDDFRCDGITLNENISWTKVLDVDGSDGFLPGYAQGPLNNINPSPGPLFGSKLIGGWLSGGLVRIYSGDYRDLGQPPRPIIIDL
ncbi:MAG: hypothetical protein HWE27_04455 [Gammaproteobacteria bacterium]|nr:hypothetical protein [Gammaproteobacteria bacterium]